MNSNLQDVLKKINETYSGLTETGKLVLAVAATTRLKRQHPLAVILIGSPSSGKTSILMPLTRGGKDTVLKESVKRIDEFTSASLVSHVGNKTEESLKKTDLLPKLDGKCIVVKEMAPFFTGSEETLAKKFSVLASVFDGDGYVSASGNHGERGYADKICFSFIGAVTPDVLTRKVHDCLSAIGSRFNFWEMPTRLFRTEEYKGPKKDRKEIEQACEMMMKNFLEVLFQKYPANSIEIEKFEVDSEIEELLGAAACMMAFARSRILIECDKDGTILQDSISMEGPDRAFRYLHQLAAGLALIDGRFKILPSDLRIVIKLAISSAESKRRQILNVFMDLDTSRTAHEVALSINVVDDTARKYLGHLERLGLVEKVNPDGTDSWDLIYPFRRLRAVYNGWKQPPRDTSFENWTSERML